jgi:hypothetical protein
MRGVKVFGPAKHARGNSQARLTTVSQKTACQKKIVPALIAVEASKAMTQIAVGEETLEDFGFDWPMDRAGGIEFTACWRSSLIERVCLRIARTVGTARRRLRVPAHRCLSASLAQYQASDVSQVDHQN